MPLCFLIQNFAEIGQSVDELWPKNRFSRWQPPPSWIFKIRFLVAWLSSGSISAVVYQTLSKSDDFSLRYGNLAIFRCSDARRSSHTHRTAWPVALFLLLLHPPGTLYLLTFDCAKTFSLSNATWKPIYSNSLSLPVLHQAPLYLRT